jgi:hypothetical protein
MEHYPDWLGRDLLAGGRPWTGAIPGSLPAFLDRYTLDDARWIGLYAEPGRCATLLLRWNPREAGADPPAGPDLGGRLFLAVGFESLERCEVRLRDRELASVLSGAANRAADLHRTQVTDQHGGEATMIHSPAIRLLCLSAGRETIPLLLPAETV